MNYFIIGLKSVAIYGFIILAIRLFGKKELAQLSVIDLAFILLISNSVQNAMVGSDSSLGGGLASAGSLFFMNYLLKQLMYKSKDISKLIQGEPIMLIYEGKVKEESMKKTSFSIEELEAAVREHGVESIDKVSLAVLEVDGNISVLSDNFQRKTSRRRKAHKVFGKESN